MSERVTSLYIFKKGEETNRNEMQKKIFLDIFNPGTFFPASNWRQNFVQKEMRKAKRERDADIEKKAEVEFIRRKSIERLELTYLEIDRI